MPTSSAARCPSASFVCEVRLHVTPQQERVLLARLEAGRQLYNACLGEAVRRLDLVRQSRLWQKARRTRDAPTRARLFAKTRRQYGFDRFSLINFATGLRESWLGRHLDSRSAYALATRAYRAASRVLSGHGRRVRFKGRNQLDSLESTDNSAGIRFRGMAVVWNGLTLPARVRGNRETIAHALSCRIKYTRLVRRKVHGKNRFYAQLVCEGQPLPRVVAGDGVVGVDLGVSHLAYVGETAAGLCPFAPGLADHRRRVRRLQRHLDRQRRANNPEQYLPDGQIKPKTGRRWKVSRGMRRTEARLGDLLRREAAQRRCENGHLAHRVVAAGREVRAERVSVRAWQRVYGRSIGWRAPGACLRRIASMAASAGGGLRQFSTRSTRLSQTCICGARRKKALSERVHACPCGLTMQRDLLSAYLARHVSDDRLQAASASEGWQGAEQLLRAAWSLYQSATPRRRAAKAPADAGQSGSRAQPVHLALP